jgi:hypothetical protein
MLISIIIVTPTTAMATHKYLYNHHHYSIPVQATTIIQKFMMIPPSPYCKVIIWICLAMSCAFCSLQRATLHPSFSSWRINDNHEESSSFMNLSSQGQASSLPSAHKTTADLLSSSSSSSSSEAAAAAEEEELPSLSVDWENIQPTSTLAQAMVAHQSNCTLPSAAYFRFRNRFGLGSDLHLWARAVCNAMEIGNVRVLTQQQDWIYRDQQMCDNKQTRMMRSHSSEQPSSALACYFPQVEPTCPPGPNLVRSNELSSAGVASTSVEYPVVIKLYRGLGRISWNCPNLLAKYTPSQIEAAAIEVLFTNLSSDIVRNAQRLLRDVFGPRGTIPNNLITCHIRWGDKGDEMELVPITEYVQATATLSKQLQTTSSTSSLITNTTNVFVATEDPRAVEAFVQAAPTHWTIFVDPYVKKLRHHRQSVGNNVYNGHVMLAKQLGGYPASLALASLLVAMEGRAFVLTMASNWSRLMNEIRQNILEPQRGGIPHPMIDLRSL